MFKAKIGWISDGLVCWFKPLGPIKRVKVVDPREITAEKAVEKVLQSLFNAGVATELLFEAAKIAGMVADVTTESRVRVRRGKK